MIGSMALGERTASAGCATPSHHQPKRALKHGRWLVLDRLHNDTSKVRRRNMWKLTLSRQVQQSQKTRASEVGRPKRPCDMPSEVRNGNCTLRLRSRTLDQFLWKEPGGGLIINEVVGLTNRAVLRHSDVTTITMR